MNIRKFYRKYQDIIELSKGYLGIIVILLIIVFFKWIPTNLDGIFNSQVETILNVCVNGVCG